MDVARGEMVEGIERRARQNGPDRDRDELWAASVRRYHERRRKEIRAEWYCYFCGLAESLRSRAAEADRRAEAFLEEEAR